MKSLANATSGTSCICRPAGTAAAHARIWAMGRLYTRKIYRAQARCFSAVKIHLAHSSEVLGVSLGASDCVMTAARMAPSTDAL